MSFHSFSSSWLGPSPMRPFAGTLPPPYHPWFGDWGRRPVSFPHNQCSMLLSGRTWLCLNPEAQRISLELF
jgi:hypothetical protein